MGTEGAGVRAGQGDSLGIVLRTEGLGVGQVTGGGSVGSEARVHVERWWGRGTVFVYETSETWEQLLRVQRWR